MLDARPQQADVVAGLAGCCVTHGLRKAAARRLAEPDALPMRSRPSPDMPRCRRCRDTRKRPSSGRSHRRRCGDWRRQNRSRIPKPVQKVWECWQKISVVQMAWRTVGGTKGNRTPDLCSVADHDYFEVRFCIWTFSAMSRLAGPMQKRTWQSLCSMETMFPRGFVCCQRRTRVG